MKQFVLLFFLLLCISTLNAQSTDQIDQLIFNEQYTKAIPQLQKKIKKNPTNAKLEYKLGKIYQVLEQNQKAAIHLRKAQQLDSTSTKILYQLSNSLVSCGQYPESLQYLEKLIKIDSNHYQGNLLLAKTYSIDNQFDKSIRIYSRLIKQDSLNPYLHKQLGLVKEKMQNHIGALASYMQANELDPKDLWTILHVMQKFYDMGMRGQVIEYANKGLEIYPNNTVLLKKKAFCLVGIQWYENALEIYQLLEKNKKLDLNGFKQLGICYMQTRQYEKAIPYFLKCYHSKQFRQNYQDDPMLNYYLGVCMTRLHKTTAGIEYLEKALEYLQSPIEASIHLQLAKAYNDNREFEKSIAEYQKHFNLDNSNPEILYEIASNYEELGNNKTKALKYYTLYLNQTDKKDDKRYEYAKSRILRIKENIHFER